MLKWFISKIYSHIFQRKKKADGVIVVFEVDGKEISRYYFPSG